MFILDKEFEAISQKYSQKTAIYSSDGNWTYQELYQASKALSLFLYSQGIRKGDRVAIVLENGPKWPVVYFGLMMAGAICVPIDTQCTSFEIENLLKDSEAKLVFTSSELKEKIKDQSKVITDIDKAIINGKNVKEAFFQDNGPQDIASLIYTSGTTATPKGVMLTHKNFLSNVNSMVATGIISQKDHVLSILPLHHSYPFTVTLLFPLLKGGSVAYATSLKAEDIFKSARDFKVSIFVGVPQIFSMINRTIEEEVKKLPLFTRMLIAILKELFWIIRKLTGVNLSKIVFSKIHKNFGDSLSFFISGGAKLDKDAAKSLFKFGFTILEGYGLTETSPVVTFNPVKTQKLGSVGKALEGVSIKIAHPDSRGSGEIAIKGDNVMKGYYKRPQETQNAIKEGWFYSGDAGYIDKDGYLYITGRIKDIIVLSTGKNIYPDEIEAHYQKSRFIKEMCVFAMPTKRHEKARDTLYAVIVPNMDVFRKEGRIHIEGSIRWDLENLSKELPSYKRIMGFSISNEPLPRTRLGKIKRFEVEALYQQKMFRESVHKEKPPQKQEDAELAASQTAKKTLDFLAKECEAKIKPSLSDHLEIDLGVDSLKRIEIISGLETIFKIRLSDSFLADVYTVKELILKLSSYISQAKGKEEEVEAKKGALLWSDILAKNPKEAIVKRIDLNPGFMSQILAFIFQKGFWALFSIFFFLRISGRKNIPKQGPYILCVNHTSYFDGFIVASSVRYSDEKKLFFLGYSGYFEHPFVAWGIRVGRLIPIDPASQLVDAMQASSFVLRHKKALCVFPEGERSSDGSLIEFKKGIGILAKELDIPLVPVCIKGAFNAWPRTKAFPRPYPIRIKYGAPLSAGELLDKGRGFGVIDDYEAIAMAIRQAIKDLEQF